jgi:hypothetical protein
MSDNRRGHFGQAKPAFTVHRFKRTITINLNEEMADEVLGILEAHEDAHKAVPSHIWEFTTQLGEALDQPPPSKGEKPEILAPGRPRTPVVKAV